MPNAPINTLDISYQEVELNEEKVELTYDSLDLEMSDDDLVVAINNRVDRASKYWAKLKVDDRRKTNFKYWIGDQIDEAKVRDDLEKGVDNAIFRNIETLIPIANSRTPEVSVTPNYKNDQTRDFAKDMQRLLQTDWEVNQGMQSLLGRGIRNHQIDLIAVFMYGWDAEHDKPWTEEVMADNLVISQYGDFIARYIKDKTIGDLIEQFPDKKKEILATVGFTITSVEPNKQILASPVEYLEVWTDEFVAWKLDRVILDKSKNPHYDYDGREIEIPSDEMEAVTDADGLPELDEMGRPLQQPKMTKKEVYFNHFDAPKKPFLFLTYFNRGIHVLDDTSLIEQAIGPQDWINKRKRQIGMNADSTNGHWVSSGDYISMEEFSKIDGSIDEKIWLENGNPKDGINKVVGEALPAFVYNDLQDSRSVIDNLMGTHSTTRGEKSGNDTATQDIMQKDQDFGRIDGYIRDGIENFSKHWYDAMYHMYLVYSLDEKSIAIPDDDDMESENVVFSRDSVPLVELKDGTLQPVKLILRVKQGSTLPRDEVSEYHRAKELRDSLNPIDYFKLMGLPNPRELAKNKLIWDTDPFYMFKDDQDMQEVLQMMQQRKAEEMQAAQAATTGEGLPAEAGGPSATGVSKAMKSIVNQGGGQDGPSAEGVSKALKSIVGGQNG